MGMKKFLVAAAAAASVIAIAAPASAETYGTLGYGLLDTRHYDLDTVTARFGWKSATPFGVEGEATVGVGRDEVAAGKIKLNNSFALYGTASTNVNDTVSVHARVGVAETQLEVKPVGSDNHSSINYGVGATWMFAGQNGARFDYTRQDYKGGAFEDADIYSVAYVRKF
jgi:hypothetical protein